MSDIKKFLQIMNESTAGASVSGGVATVEQGFAPTQRRTEETSEDEDSAPKILEYGMWENSALATTSKLKKNRGKSSKVVKSIYGEDESTAQGKKVEENTSVKKKMGENALLEGMDPDKRARLDSLIDEYRDATDPGDYYDRDYSDPEEVIDLIRAEFGDNIADKVSAGADKMHFTRPGHTSWQADPLGWKKPVDRETKAGKMYKQDSDFRKNTIKSRYKLSGKSATESVAEGSVFDVDTTGYTKNDMNFINNNINQIKKIRVKLLKIPGFARKINDETSQLQLAEKIFNLMKRGQTFDSALVLAQKQGVAEAAKWRDDDREGKTWRSPDWDDGDLSPSKIKIDRSGKDVDDSGDELTSRPGAWRGKADMAKRMTKKGVPTKSELAFQNNLKMRMRMKRKEGGLTGPKGVLPEQGVAEGTLKEQDLILNPASISRNIQGLMPRGIDRTDHEVEMAKSDLYQAGKNASAIFKMIKDLSEDQGLEGWVQEKITKAADYLNTVQEYLEGKQFSEQKMFWDADRPAEPWNTIDRIAGGVKMQESMDGVSPSTKMFAEKQQHTEGKCSKCGGASYDDEMIAEEKDACYSKVKSRYKVWPSAYASGALVKCRKVGAKNWGSSKK